LLAEPLVVFGPRKSDAFITRSDALVALTAIVDPKAKKKIPVASRSLGVVAAPGGHSAWAVDVVAAGGDTFAMTSILTNSDDIWSVNAVALAVQHGRDDTKLENARDAIVPPAAESKAKVDDAAKGAVDRFEKGLLDQQVWGDDLMARDDAVFVGPTAGEITRGKADLKKLWKKRVAAGVREAVSGEISAATTPDGQIAWVTAPVTRVDDKGGPMPLRAFAVFAKDGGDWKLAALHESLAVDQPGAGAGFKRKLPPKPEPKVEDKPVEKKKTKTTEAPKKKKKRSRR
jgi:ketosteroid isomerase-like protein